MAPKSAWSLMDPNTIQQLSQAGAQALASGKVSLADAKKNALSLGIDLSGMDADPSAPNPLAMLHPTASGPLDMTAQPSQANDLYQELGDIGDKKGAKVQSERSDTTTLRRSSNRLLTKPPEQIRAEELMAQGMYPNISGYEDATDEQGNPIFDRTGKQVQDRDHPIYDFSKVDVDPNNPVQQQVQGLNRMQDLLGMETDANMKRPLVDLRPLAALADARNAEMGRPTKLTDSMQAPPDVTGRFMAYADEIQKRRADIAKAISENARMMRGGSTMDMLVQALAAKDLAGQQNPTYDRQQMAQDRMDYMAHQRTVQAIRGDKTLRDRLTQYQNLNNAISNLMNADHMTPQQFDEAQQAIRANLGIKGTSGVGERERTQINNLGLSWDRISQILQAKPADISQPENVAHIKSLAGLESSNIRQQFGSRLNAIAGGNASVYERHPEYQSDLDQMLGAQLAQITPTKPARSAGAGRKSAAPQTQAQKALGAGAAAPSQGGGMQLPSLDDIDAELKKRGK